MMLHQLFIPINMSGYHWYLAVANAKKREIQVLVSLGSRVKRNDLATTVIIYFLLILTHVLFGLIPNISYI
mgnify:CR=1 FL=1